MTIELTTPAARRNTPTAVNFAGSLDQAKNSPPTTGLGQKPNQTLPLPANGNNPQIEEIAQAPPTQKAASVQGNSAVGQALWGVLPDALVYSNGKLDNPATRNFVLVNPLTGGITHFINHKTNKGVAFGLPVTRVESVQYSFGSQVTRREDGVGWAQANARKDLVVFVNMRGGDTNFASSQNGVSMNAGFFGSRSRLNGVAQALSRSNNSGVRAFGAVMRETLRLATASGQQVGVAWRGTITYDNKSKQAVLNISGHKIPLADFKAALNSPPPLNYSDKPTAMQNNFDGYLAGANPFETALQTRAPSGKFLNHSDPVSDIAGRIHQIQQRLFPGKPLDVRSNFDASVILTRAIAARDASAINPDLARALPPGDRAELPSAPAGGRAFNSQDRAYLNETLALMHQYGIAGLYGPNIATEAKTQAQSLELTSTPKNQRFVQDVFEGDFRPISGGDIARDVLLGLNRWTAGAALLLEQTPLSDGTVFKKNNSMFKGLQRRIDANDGGVLQALNVPSGGRRGKDYENFEQTAMSALYEVLLSKVEKSNQKISAETLYQAFVSMPQAERNNVGALLNAKLNPP